jgi:hypothetical protein
MFAVVSFWAQAAVEVFYPYYPYHGIQRTVDRGSQMPEPLGEYWNL